MQILSLQHGNCKGLQLMKAWDMPAHLCHPDQVFPSPVPKTCTGRRSEHCLPHCDLTVHLSSEGRHLQVILGQATCNLHHFKPTQDALLACDGCNTSQALTQHPQPQLRSHLLAAPSCTCMARRLDFSELDFADPCEGQATSSEPAAQVLQHSCSPLGPSGVVTRAG